MTYPYPILLARFGHFGVTGFRVVATPRPGSVEEALEGGLRWRGRQMEIGGDGGTGGEEKR